MQTFIRKFSDISLADLQLVGGKNASLGEMFNALKKTGIAVPDGFATTADAFWVFMEENNLTQRLSDLLNQLDRKGFSNLKEIGSKARSMIMDATMLPVITEPVLDAFHQLCRHKDSAVAVRSSATAEDLPQASFAGQHDSFLNIRDEHQLVRTIHKCFASLYTDRAIKYREDHGFAHQDIALSVGVQHMVRSDKGCSGVAFTIEPESGFSNIVHISGVWGLGENMVQGTVNPDEFLVFKPMLSKGKNAIVQKRRGDKALTMVYAPAGSEKPLMNQETPHRLQQRLVLTDAEVLRLARWCVVIEEHYGMPMDIEWAKDGISGALYIIQARPETVQSVRNNKLITRYHLRREGRVLGTGQAIGEKVAFGRARVLYSPHEKPYLRENEILVTNVTSPDWDPVMKKAAAIVTDKGGRTSHASIVARELGVPAIVGCGNISKKIKDGDWITVSCCEGKTGKVYEGEIPFDITEYDFSKTRKPSQTKVMLILADPESAFHLSFLPNDGVGLLRLEFIINHHVQVHPMALAQFDAIQDAHIRQEVDRLTPGYVDKKQFFIDKLAEGVATIAAAFYPKEVIVRLSDFKTNEYAHLIGGGLFEPAEENPMLGFRGAFRYTHPLYRQGFALECAALKKVREEMGFSNVIVMVPFCRTVEEGRSVIAAMEANGLSRKDDPGLKLYMMAEVPSNVLLAEKFATVFDGFSIGSNDLTQLTLGVDRDSSLMESLFSEKNEAVQLMIGEMILKARKAKRSIGICGQAPSDHPGFARLLVQKGINSISFSPDALLKGIANIREAEKTVPRQKEVAKAAPQLL